MSEVNKRDYALAKTDIQKIDVLIKDFQHENHYGLLTAYNGPLFTQDYISTIEAGKLLVRIS